MKKTLLFGFLVASFLTNAQTITAEDLKWTVGNQWINVVNPLDTNTIVKTGTGVNWDFSAVTTGTKDTLKIVASTSADIKFASISVTSADYKDITGNYAVGSISGFNADDATSMHIGMPHTYNQTWTSAASAGFGFITVDLKGSVPASGTISLPYGTFNCLLVRENITGANGTINQTNLYWETAEHGRVAIFDQGNLSVMQSTNFTTSVETLKSKGGLSLYPNPAKSIVNVNTDDAVGVVTLFDAVGNTVQSVTVSATTTVLSLDGLSAGVYVVQYSNKNSIETASVVVK